MYNSFFVLKRPDKLKITFKNDKIKIDKSIYEKYKKKNLKYKKYLLKLSNKETTKLNNMNKIYNNNMVVTNIVLKTFGFFDYKLSSTITFSKVVSKDNFKLSLTKFLTDKNSITLCNNITKCKVKSYRLLRNIYSYEIYKKIKSMQNNNKNSFLKDIIIRIITLKYLSTFYDILEDGGSAFINIFSYFDIQIINILYLLTFMFNKVYINEQNLIYCDGFLGSNSLIKKNNILKLIKEKSFTIEKDEKNVMDLLEYFNNNIKYDLKKDVYLFKNDFDTYINFYLYKFINQYYQYGSSFIPPEQMDLVLKYYINLCKNNSSKKLYKIIKNNEIKIISDIISKYNYTSCLEYRLKFGFYSLAVLFNKNIKKLITINDEKDTVYKDRGKKLINKLGYSKKHKIINNNINLEINKLLKKKILFDMIIINGYSQYDFIDSFYDYSQSVFDYDDELIQNVNDATLLLKKDGKLIITETIRVSMKKLINYIDNTFSFYIKMDIPSESIVVYTKI